MIDVRPAAPTDGAAVGAVHAASWAAAYAPFFDREFAAAEIDSRLTRWHDRLRNPSGLILLARLDDRPLGLSWSVPSTERPGHGEILSLYAHPDGWGTGVAAELMTTTLEHLRQDGYRQVHLWTLRDTPRSRRFYVKSGFAETGQTRDRDFGDGHPLAQLEFARTN
ncbi:GNAT family N-acetyltransferase [Kribbella sp. DT2]|uniref:GNAT family N-acetyltransferase n=1 Tax=Kribbella sp. DT2 TaxID=3393427 RepID=UPI003CF11FA6